MAASSISSSSSSYRHRQLPGRRFAAAEAGPRHILFAAAEPPPAHTSRLYDLAKDDQRTASQEDLLVRVARYTAELAAQTAELATSLSPGTALAVSCGAPPETEDITRFREAYSARSRGFGTTQPHHHASLRRRRKAHLHRSRRGILKSAVAGRRVSISHINDDSDDDDDGYDDGGYGYDDPYHDDDYDYDDDDDDDDDDGFRRRMVAASSADVSIGRGRDLLHQQHASVSHSSHSSAKPHVLIAPPSAGGGGGGSMYASVPERDQDDINIGAGRHHQEDDMRNEARHDIDGMTSVPSTSGQPRSLNAPRPSMAVPSKMNPLTDASDAFTVGDSTHGKMTRADDQIRPSALISKIEKRLSYKDRIKNMKPKIPRQRRRAKVELSDMERREEKMRTERSEAIVQYLEMRRQEFHEEMRQDILERAERSRARRQKLEDMHARYITEHKAKLTKPNGPRRPPQFPHTEKIPEHYKSKTYRQVSSQLHPASGNQISNSCHDQERGGVAHEAAEEHSVGRNEQQQSPTSTSPVLTQSHPLRHQPDAAQTSSSHTLKFSDTTAEDLSDRTKARAALKGTPAEAVGFPTQTSAGHLTDSSIDPDTKRSVPRRRRSSSLKPRMSKSASIVVAENSIVHALLAKAAAVKDTQATGLGSRIYRSRSSIVRTLPTMISLERQIGLSGESIELWEGDASEKKIEQRSKTKRRQKFNAMADSAYRHKVAAVHLFTRFNDIPFRDFMSGMPIDIELEQALTYNDDEPVFENYGGSPATGAATDGAQDQNAITTKEPDATSSGNRPASSANGSGVTSSAIESSSSPSRREASFGSRGGHKRLEPLQPQEMESLTEKILAASRRPGLMQEVKGSVDQSSGRQTPPPACGNDNSNSTRAASSRSQRTSRPPTSLTVNETERSDRPSSPQRALIADRTNSTAITSSPLTTPLTSRANTGPNDGDSSELGSTPLAASLPSSRPLTTPRSVNFGTGISLQEIPFTNENRPFVHHAASGMGSEPSLVSVGNEVAVDADKASIAKSDTSAVQLSRMLQSSEDFRGGVLERTDSFYLEQQTKVDLTTATPGDERNGHRSKNQLERTLIPLGIEDVLGLQNIRVVNATKITSGLWKIR